MSETELPERASRIMEQLGESFKLSMDAKSGRLSDEPQTRTFIYRGDAPAEALGYAYSTRDTLRDAGYPTEANLIGPSDIDGFYEVELRINHED